MAIAYPVDPSGIGLAGGITSHPPLGLNTHARPASCAPLTNNLNCQTCRRPPTIRRYAEHYCQWEACCYKFPNEGACYGKDFFHIPVCHELCWRLESGRLEAGARERREPRMSDYGLSGCHRECYMRDSRRVIEPEGRDLEMVPPKRTVGEWLGMAMVDHWIWERRNRREGTIVDD